MRWCSLKGCNSFSLGQRPRFAESKRSVNALKGPINRDIPKANIAARAVGYNEPMPRFTLRDLFLAVGLIAAGLAAVMASSQIEVFDSLGVSPNNPAATRACRAAALGGMCGLLVFLWKLSRR